MKNCTRAHASCFDCRDYECGCQHEADCECSHYGSPVEPPCPEGTVDHPAPCPGAVGCECDETEDAPEQPAEPDPDTCRGCGEDCTVCDC